MQPTYTIDQRPASSRPSTEAALRDVYRFPRTPEAQRMRRPAVSATRQTTPETLRQRQIDSAVENAYGQFRQQESGSTSEELRAWAQWIMQAGQVLDGWRQERTGK